MEARLKNSKYTKSAMEICIRLLRNYRPLKNAQNLLNKPVIRKHTLSMCKMCRFTSSCTCAKSYPGIGFLFEHYVVFNDSVNGQ